jgi:hypothetical protein
VVGLRILDGPVLTCLSRPTNVEKVYERKSQHSSASTASITEAHVRLHTVPPPVLGNIQLNNMAAKEEYLAEAVLPQALAEVTVQLIFSEGPDIGGEQLYITALSPFCLGNSKPRGTDLLFRPLPRLEPRDVARSCGNGEQVRGEYRCQRCNRLF